MRRSPSKRKTPQRPVAKKAEIRAWQRKRWDEAEALLNKIYAHGMGPAMVREVGDFVRGFKQRPKRRRRTLNVPGRITLKELDALWGRIILQRDGYACRKCGATKESGAQLHPHHVRAKGGNPALRYEPDNGLTLCATCHLFGKDAAHSTDPRPFQAWLESNDGLGRVMLQLLDSLAMTRKGSKLDRTATKLYLEGLCTSGAGYSAAVAP